MPVKLHHICIPTHSRGLAFVMLFFLGFYVCWLGSLAAMFVAFRATGWMPMTYGLQELLVIIVLVLGACFLSAYLCLQLQQAHALFPTRHRTARLRRIMATRGALDRLPHRHVEHALRLPRHRANKVDDAVRHHPPELITVVTAVQIAKDILAQPSNIAFEPVEIETESAKIFEVAKMLWPQKPGATDSEADAHQWQSSRGTPSRIVRLLWRPYAKVVVTLLALCVFAVQLATATDPLPTVAILCGALCIIACSFLWPLVFQRKWWAVPGGLIYREDHIWRKGLAWGLVTPCDSPLVMDTRTGDGRVRVDDRILRFRAAPFARWVVIAGWMSTAPPPTRNEVRAFLGIPDPTGDATDAA